MSDEQRSSQDLPPTELGAEGRVRSYGRDEDGPDVEGHRLPSRLQPEDDEAGGEERIPGR